MSTNSSSTYLGFFNKVVFAHGPLLHHLHGHIDGPLPFAASHHAKLPAAQLLPQGQLSRIDLPLAVAEARRGGLGATRRAF